MSDDLSGDMLAPSWPNLVKEDLCRIFPVMISVRGLLYVTVRYSFVPLCILSFTACLLKPQGILNSQGRFAFVSKSIHLVYLLSVPQGTLVCVWESLYLKNRAR